MWRRGTSIAVTHLEAAIVTGETFDGATMTLGIGRDHICASPLRNECMISDVGAASLEVVEAPEVSVCVRVVSAKAGDESRVLYRRISELLHRSCIL